MLKALYELFGSLLAGVAIGVGISLGKYCLDKLIKLSDKEKNHDKHGIV